MVQSFSSMKLEYYECTILMNLFIVPVLFSSIFTPNKRRKAYVNTQPLLVIPEE